MLKASNIQPAVENLRLLPGYPHKGLPPIHIPHAQSGQATCMGAYHPCPYPMPHQMRTPRPCTIPHRRTSYSITIHIPCRMRHAPYPITANIRHVGTRGDSCRWHPSLFRHAMGTTLILFCLQLSCPHPTPCMSYLQVGHQPGATHLHQCIF